MKIGLESYGGVAIFVDPQIRELSAANPQSAIPTPQSLTPYEILTSPDYEWSEPENLGPVVNSKENDGGPFLSADGLTLLFDSNRSGGQGAADLWMCRRASLAAPWSAPENLGPTINSSSIDRQPALATDSLTLYFSSNRGEDPSIYYLYSSTRKTTADPWSAPQRLEAAANFPQGNYGSPEPSAGGLALYFYAQRTGGLGNNDLWLTRRPSTAEPWGAAVNLGPVVNTDKGDLSPALSSDSRVLLFSSDRQAGSQGLSDLWLCTRDSLPEPWSAPRNLGRPVNVAESDGGPCLSQDGSTLIYNSDRSGGLGGSDLWMSVRVPKPKPAVPPAVPQTPPAPAAVPPKP